MKIQHLPLGLFCLYFLKVTILPISYPEVLALLILGATASFFEFKNNEKKIQELESTIKNSINSFEATIKDSLVRFEDKSKQMEHIKETFNAMKLSSLVKVAGSGK